MYIVSEFLINETDEQATWLPFQDDYMNWSRKGQTNTRREQEAVPEPQIKEKNTSECKEHHNTYY